MELDVLRDRFLGFDRALDRRPDLVPHAEALAAAGMVAGTLEKYLADADDAAMARFAEALAACDYDWVTRLREALKAPARSEERRVGKECKSR